MAKLKAYGQKEVCRATWRGPPTSDSGLTVEEQTDYAVMDNGRLLRRLVVWFKPGPYDPGKPRRHDYGWKVELGAGKVKAAKVRPWLAKLEEKGYTWTKGPAWDAFTGEAPDDDGPPELKKLLSF